MIHALVLYADESRTLSYYDDWREAIVASKRFDAETVNICATRPGAFRRRVADFDALVLLHSTNADSLFHIRRWMPVLERRRGRLFSFVGNEFNYPGCWLGDRIAWLRQLRPDFVGTQLVLEAGRYLYGDLPNCEVVALPHALNPDRFHPTTPRAGRPVEIGVRSYRYLAIMGDDDRNRLIDFFDSERWAGSLVTDIRTDPAQRLGADDWARFLNRCKATISTEVGTSYLERDDRTVKAILAFIRERQSNGAQSVYSRLRAVSQSVLPATIRRAMARALAATPWEQTHREVNSLTHESVVFTEVYERFFKDYPAPVSGKAISSRHFDAAGTKTLQIMFPGRFNDILTPDVHYLALARDFSNIGDVLERFRDPGYHEQMCDRTLHHVLSAHTYAHRVEQLARLFS